MVSSTHYTKYYQVQSGAGLGDIGTLYRGPPAYFLQRGSGGIGNFFHGMLKYLQPLLSSGLDAVKRQSMKTGVAILQDLADKNSNKPFGQILREQGKTAVEELTQRGLAKLKKMQSGSGAVAQRRQQYRKITSRGIKRRTSNKMLQLKRTQPRLKQRRLGVKGDKITENSTRLLPAAATRKRKRVLDIFD